MPTTKKHLKKINKYLSKLKEMTGATPVVILKYKENDFLIFGLDECPDVLVAEAYDKLFPSLIDEIEDVGRMKSAELTAAYTIQDINDMLGESNTIAEKNERERLQNILFDALSKMKNFEERRKG